MYITNFTHFLDEDGNIPLTIPREARELASFLAMIVDEATKHFPERRWNTDIRCFNPACDSNAITEFVEEGNNTHWFCPECNTEGLIADWQDTKWDNIGMRLTRKEKQLLDNFFHESLSEEDKKEFLRRASSDRDFLKKFVRRLGKEVDREDNIK